MGVQINGDTGNVIATKGTFSGDVGIGGTLTYEDVTNIDSVGLITARNGIEIGARPGVAASISVDGNAVFSGIVTASSFSGIDTDKISEGNTEAEVVDTGSDGHFKVTTEGSERLRIIADGKVGVKKTAPNFDFDVAGNIGLTEGQVITWHDGSGTKAGDMYIDSSDNFILRNTSSVSERFRIASDGTLTSTASNNGQIIHTFKNTDATGSSSAMTVEQHFNFNRTGGGLNLSAARIVAGKEREWAGAAANQDGYFAIHTTKDETSEEKMRLTSLGELKINQTGDGGWGSTAKGVVFIRGNEANNGLLRINDTGGSTNQKFIRFQYNDHGNNCGGIRREGLNTTPEFFSGSDYRIKTNIQDMPNVLDKINQIKIKTWELKNDPNSKGLSPIAQELVHIFPDKVEKTDDGTGDTLPDGVEPWNIGHSYTWELVKSIQELSAKVETLKTEVAALKSQLNN